MSWSTSELRVRLAGRETGLSPPVKYFTDHSKAVLLLWIFYAFSVLRLLCLCACLFICALWSPAGKGLTFWLSFVVSNCESVTFRLVSSVLDCIDSWSLYHYLFCYYSLICKPLVICRFSVICLCHTVLPVPCILGSPVGKGLTSWLSWMWRFHVFLSLSNMVTWVRCGFCMYRFLIFDTSVISFPDATSL